MKEKETKGHIIHINSVLGHVVLDVPYLNVYAASKFAVNALAQTLINDLARENLMHIKVTVMKLIEEFSVIKLHEMLSEHQSWKCKHRVWTYSRVSSRTFGYHTSIARSRCS